MRTCIGLASGLDALRLALISCQLVPGDEVIVPAMTFVATFEAVTQAGGVPVVVDVREDDYCLDPAAAELAVSSRTRAVVPVHLYGQLADMSALRTLAEGRGLFLLEDACQAHGAVRDGAGAGQLGNAAAFSFYPGKNLGAMGDAGALVTSDPELADSVKALREHGQRRKYRHDVEGYTARLDTIQALVLRRKLRLLDGWNESRRAAAAFYTERLRGVGDLRLPQIAERSEPVWHLYVVRTADPEALAAFLRERGIAHRPALPGTTAPHRCVRLPRPQRRRLPSRRGSRGEALSLPLFPDMTELQLEHVVASVEEFFRRG